MQAFDFSGRTVFVAGGTSGINLGIAEAFAQAGAKLAVISRSQERVEPRRARLRESRRPVLGHAADVRNAEATAAALNAAHDALGDIDVLVSGAAGNFPSARARHVGERLQGGGRHRPLGTFNVLRGAHAYLRKPGAAIVNISAPQAVLAMPLQAHVCAAKAGVDMLTRVLAIEWGGDGIRVNSVIPGPIEGTEGMARLAPSEEARQKVARALPLGRSAANRTSPIW